MEEAINSRIIDSLTLRFTGKETNGDSLHELRASHVAKVLEGLVELTGDFENAGVFHDPDQHVDTEVLVRPAQEGSFLIEVVRAAAENPEQTGLVSATFGIPSIGSIIWWATKSMRADVEDFEYLDNGNVKIKWQDNTVDEVPPAAWEELKKHRRRRKKQLRKIMAPLADGRVTEVEVAARPKPDEDGVTPEATKYTLGKTDYDTVRPDDEVREEHFFIEGNAQLAAVDFDDPTQWKVRLNNRSRKAVIEDAEFLQAVGGGLSISRDDVFRVHVREDRTTKNGRTRTKWTVLSVELGRRNRGDDNS